MKIKIQESDSAEVKQAKQALIDLYNDVMEDAKSKFKSVDEKGLTEEDVDKKAQEVIKGFKVKDGEKETLLVDFVKELDDALAKLSAKVKNQENSNNGKAMSFKEAFAKEYKAKEAEIKKVVLLDGKQEGPIVFDIKEAVTIGDFNTIEAVGSASQYSLTQNTGIISAIRKRVLTYLQNVSTGTMQKPIAMWIEEIDEQGTPIFLGEGDPKTQLSVRYEERNKTAKKIAVYGKVTTELMDDLPQLMSYIQNNLGKRLDIVKEDQLFNGNDTGDNLAGLIHYATAFNGSDLAGTITDANVFDVLNAAILQVKKAFGVATGFFVNESFIAKMISIKTSTGEYTHPMASFFTIGPDGFMSFLGVQLIGTNALDGSGFDFVGGDLSVINVLSRQGLRVQIGLDGNDFTNNKKTILLEERLVQFVSANDTQVLVKGDFASAQTLLEATT
jgi:hypothetical protein